jgi:hypothetical protein
MKIINTIKFASLVYRCINPNLKFVFHLVLKTKYTANDHYKTLFYVLLLCRGGYFLLHNKE